MGLGGCTRCMQILMFTMNLFFFVISLCVVGLAAWMLSDPTFYVSMAVDHTNYFISIYILLGGGILLLLVSFLGCCGAFRQSQCMLVSFFCLLLIVVVAEIAAGAWAYYNSEDLAAMVRKNVKDTVNSEYEKSERLRMTFDAIQGGLKCCGAEYPTDWNGSKQVVIGAALDEKFFNIPKSCCYANATEEQCAKATQRLNVGGRINYDVVFSKGCVNEVITEVRNNMGTVFIIGLVLLLIQFLGLIFSLVLAFTFSKSNYKR